MKINKYYNYLLFRFCYFCNGQGTMLILGQCSKTIIWFQYIIGSLEIRNLILTYNGSIYKI